MADRMAVMEGGVLQQYDTPERVFGAPVNTFVAGFVGSPAMNLIPAEAEAAVLASPDGWRLPLAPQNARRTLAAGSRAVILGARHSTIDLHHEAAAGRLPGRVYTVEPTGDITYLHVRVGSATLVVSAAPDRRFAPDDQVWLGFDQARLHLFDGESGRALPAA
jgi:multiple sugar transport system ATP-binding protein